jgi:hypothetical protein
VDRDWLSAGAAVEFELPRHLSCAACQGGGCDVCGRSGALTLRGRDELPEIVRVTLPAWGDRQPESGTAEQALVLRIPEHGGLAELGSELPRGMLLLKVVPSDAPDPGVRRVRRTDPPPEIASSISSTRTRPTPVSVRVVGILVMLWLLLLIYLRVSGRG